MGLRPGFVICQQGDACGVVPGIAIAALAADFIYIVVNCFIAIAEDRFVGADLVVARPDGAGAGYGYRYEWERYGPFSEALAADLVELTDEDLQEDPVPLEAPAQQAVEQVRVLIEPIAGADRFTLIRLLASLDFLHRYAGRPLAPDGERPAYIESNFEEPAITVAVDRLKGFIED